MHMTLMSLLCLAVVLPSCGAGVQGGDDDVAPSRPREVPEVEVTIADRSITVEGPVAAEPTTLVATNEGKNPHQVYLARLNAGVGASEVEKALQRGPDALFELITIAGSFPGEGKKFGRVSPGAAGRLTIDFPEGTYMIIDPEVEGPPPFALFDVTAATGDAPREPDADYSVEMGEFYFEFEGVRSGPAVVEMINVGEQGHEVSIGKGIESEGGEEQAFSFAPPPGGRLWTTMNVDVGTYEVICFLPDPKTGKPHFKLGMKSTLHVE